MMFGLFIDQNLPISVKLAQMAFQRILKNEFWSIYRQKDDDFRKIDTNGFSKNSQIILQIF